MNAFAINLIAAWTGILLGFVTGMILGMFFHRENWLGGYGSMRRRMYRLGHISFFGLAAVNLFFYFTAQEFPALNFTSQVAAWVFIIGAITMPLCCVLMAHWPKLHLIFAVPVMSLIAGGALTLVEVVRL